MSDENKIQPVPPTLIDEKNVQSVLPTLTKKEKEIIKTTFDHYMREYRYYDSFCRAIVSKCQGNIDNTRLIVKLLRAAIQNKDNINDIYHEPQEQRALSDVLSMMSRYCGYFLPLTLFNPDISNESRENLKFITN